MFRPDRRSLLALLATLPLALTARPARAATHSVTIEGFAFSPADLTVAVGDTITFTNMDGAPHTATADDGSFDTGRLNRSQSGEITITAAGSFPSKCACRPNMRGTIPAA
ncbi:cupredoxin domain-containing protein [Nioella sp.]|uniref:cupredoxin domain-containing protein n=1 Tax=Nioella sp. TaxID=1912091 RepID=UPI0035172676